MNLLQGIQLTVYISSDEYAGFVQRQDVYGAMWHWYIGDQYCQQCT